MVTVFSMLTFVYDNGESRLFHVKPREEIQSMYARPIACLERPKAHVWRFYTEADEWKWQRLSVAGEVIAESAMTYKSYDDCLADARGGGYVFQAAQSRKLFDSSRHVRPTKLM
jgi:hypothetical protein